MVKKWFTCLLALLLVFSMTITSLVVYADEPVVKDGTTTEDGTTSEGGATEGTEGTEGTEETVPTKGPAANNNGASESLDGFELVSSDSDDPSNLDLYFYEKELAFKIAQKDAAGNIVKVWSSQLLPQDLEIDSELPIKYAEESSAAVETTTIDGIKYTELMRQIAKAEGLVESNYVASSWKKMNDVLATSKAALESKNQDEVDAAEETLKDTIAAMEKKPLRSQIFSYDKQSMSLFVINYVNLGNTVTTTEYTTTSYEQEKEIVGEVTKTGSGVSFQVYFPTINITVPITVEVDGQELNVTIPKEGIYENLEGAQEVQDANTKMESLIEEINDLIEKTKKLFKSKDDKLLVEATFSGITGQLQMVKDAALTGVFKDVKSSDILASVNRMNIDFERRGYFEIGGVKENTESIIAKTDECMENYDIIAGEIANGIYSIEVMPFLGSATCKEEGYVFYPDGAGALSYFQTTHPTLLGHYEQAVYTDHIFNLEYMWNDMTSNTSLYPVWGVNKGKQGFVAIIDEGDVDASLEYWPGNDDYALNRIFSSLMFRRKAKYIKGTATYESYEIQRIDYDRKLKYIFLADENAEYSGMANAYRDYLEANEMLNHAIAEGESMPLAVDFMGGAKEQGILWETTVPMTTYAEIQATLERLKADGVNTRIYSNIYEWTKQAYNPNPLNADNGLGGAKDLKALNQYASDNNVVLGLEVNPIWAQKDYSSGEQMNKFFVRDSTTLLVNYNSRTYVFSPAYIQDKYASKLISKLKTYGANCAQLNSIGYYLYYDYSVYYDTTTSRGDTAQIFAEFAKLANDELGYSSISSGNMYMWKYASRIDSMPLTDLEYLYSDQSVPFLQMVLHGSIPYSGSVPYNVMYDDEKQMLQYIEFGCMPYFFLTQKESSEMNLTSESWSYDWLYSSDIDTWYDTMVDVYKEFSENVGYLWSEKIVDHKQIQDGVKRVEYSDGSVIYINYNEAEVTFADPESGEEVTIGAQTYEVRRGA